MTVASEAMPKKRSKPPEPGVKKSRPKGRPKGAGRIETRYAIIATSEHKQWMEKFMEHLGEPEVSEVFREAIRRYAKSTGFDLPPRR